jgi:hypothetical protein
MTSLEDVTVVKWMMILQHLFNQSLICNLILRCFNQFLQVPRSMDILYSSKEIPQTYVTGHGSENREKKARKR